MDSFWRAYLFGFALWFGISLGALCLTLIHNLTGGKWGDAIRRYLEAAMKLIPWGALMFLPIAIGAKSIYPWAAPGAAEDHVISHKALYLNLPFFYVRAAIYFGCWIWLSKAASREDERNTPRAEYVSGFGLVIHSLAVTFAGFDWYMSLDPHWFSTMYGPIFGVSQMLTAFAFLICYAAKREQIETVALHDLGKLLFAHIVLWAYLSFSQFLITWSGNLPEEAGWYLRRMQGGWDKLGVGLIVLHFFVPFFLMLPRSTKRIPSRLVRMATYILLVRCLDLFWLIAPDLVRGGEGRLPVAGPLSINPLDVIVPAVLGLVWYTFFKGKVQSWKTSIATT